MVAVPVRDTDPVFASTVSVTVPFPVPVAPAVTVNQLSLLAAFHEHPAWDVTVTLAVCPAATALLEVGLMA